MKHMENQSAQFTQAMSVYLPLSTSSHLDVAARQIGVKKATLARIIIEHWLKTDPALPVFNLHQQSERAVP